MSIFNICLCLLLSFTFIGLGFYGLKRGFAKEQLRRSLVTWQVFGKTSPLPQTVADVERSWRYLHAITFLGGGIGVILMVMCMIVISLVTSGTVDGNATGDGLFFSSVLYSSLFVGCGIGGMFAVWRMRRATKRRITYADLRRRRLSDYRSGLFLWIPLVAMVETVALSWFFAPHLGGSLPLLQSKSVVDVSRNLWIVSVAPAAMGGVVLVAEFLMSRLARFSRLLITSNSSVSQRADDMLRATAIGMTQTYVLITVAYLGLFQAGFILRSLWASGYWHMGNRPYAAITDVFFLVLLLTLGLGAGLAAVYGPHGGKHPGWPWQIRPIKQSEGEQ